MARVPDVELERLKREVSVERLAERRGVVLVRRGADLVGCCPFHEDKTPSLVITPEKNLWHCLGACATGGSPIDWVMKAEGVSFRHAVELLLTDGPALAAKAGPPPKLSSVKKLPAPVAQDADDRELMRSVVGYYHQALKQSPEALGYLEKRGLRSAELVEKFQLGFANRTLGYRLPHKSREAGAELRGRLQRLGVLRDTGHEHFNGSLVVPIFDAGGNVAGMYGRKVTPGLRKGTPSHLYLPGPHRGVWNEAALAASKTVILCEALLDAMTFWVNGFRNVTASYGVNGFTEDHLEALRRHGVEQVLIAYDRDPAGDKAAQELGLRLVSEGLCAYRVQLPAGHDVNLLAQHCRPGTDVVAQLSVHLRRAVWIGQGSPRPAQRAKVEELAEAGLREAIAKEDGVASPAAAVRRPALPSAAALELPPGARQTVGAYGPQSPCASVPARANGSAPRPGGGGPALAALPRVEPAPALVVAAPAVEDLDEPLATPVPAAPRAPEVPAEVTAEEVVVRLGDRRYRVRGLGKNLSPEQLKVNLLASRDDAAGGGAPGAGFHVDTLDLYSARHRVAYVKQAAGELGLKEEIVKKDLGKLLLKLEELQEANIQAALGPKKQEPVQSAEELAAALELLRDPKLLDRILVDFEKCGVVGEETNKLMGYLAAVSRKLEEPLAVIVQSSSAAGKTSLMEAVLAFMPEEERVKYSAMTGQSLFYLGESDLKHKILAIVEEEGAQRAAYALKLLQSEGELTIASTGKDPETGRLVTHEYRVEGPVMIFLTTTAVEIDEELLNRCLVLTVNEEREQTRAIHRLQRRRQTLPGLLARQDRAQLLAVHKNAQRLLRPLLVVNPFAEELTFLDDRTRTRRDHVKYLTLIRCIALLHQHQRPVQTVEHGGKVLEYLEVLPADVEVANRLAHQVLGRSLDELPPQSRRLLLSLERMVAEACGKLGIERSDHRFTRRDARAHTGWSDFQVRVHLEKLVALEYVLVHRGGRGQSFVYELCYDGKGQDGSPFLMGLVDAGTLGVARTYDGNFEGSGGEFEGGSSPHRGVIEAPTSPAETEESASSRGSLAVGVAAPARNAHQGENGAPSYARDGRGHDDLAGALAAASSALEAR